MRSRMASTACSAMARAPRVRHAGGLSGQSTVEFALVTAALLCVVIGLSAFWRLAGQGVLVEHAVAAASHHVAGAASAVADVFAF